MTTLKQRGFSPWRIVKPIVKPLLPVCYKVFPASKNIKRYRDTFGRLPNVIRPKTFNERIQRRILFDRNPRLALFADKLRVREYVRSILGDDQCLTKLYAVVTSAAEIGQLSLPAKYVMKPNHASGMVKIVTDSTRILPGELEALAVEWLRINYYDITQEWAYKNIERRVMFEELLEVDGEIAPDFKFYCFGGEPRLVHVVRDRLGELKVNSYDVNLSLLPVKLNDRENFRDEIRAPPNFNRMLEVARRLSAGTDFQRVDLYNVNGRIVFGELTNYVANGRTRFQPPEWDLKYGSYWR
jgi:hypothetical protein